MNYVKAKRALKRGHAIRLGDGKRLTNLEDLANYVDDYGGKNLRMALKNARIEE